MTTSSSTALRQALRLAGPDTADALAERLRPELLAALSDRFGLPEEVVAELVGPGGASLRAAMAADHEAFLLRAAETGDPAIARALWDARYRPASQHPRRVKDIPGLLAAVLRAADPSDPRWYEEDGLVPLLQEEATGVELAPALTGPFPALIAYSLVRLAPNLPLPAALDAGIALVQLAGGEGLAAFVRAVEEAPDIDLGHPGLLDLMRSAAAAADPESFLRERRPAGEWTDPAALQALLMVRDGHGSPAKPDGLDWELVRREHARLPFGTETRHGSRHRSGNRLLGLIGWEGCPHDLVMESFREHPMITARLAAELPFEALVGAEARAGTLRFEEVLGRGIREGRLSVDRVLTEVTPAAEVLRSLPYDHEPTRKALAALADRLGTDPVNWLTCYARTGRARGSVAELIADAASATSRKKRNTTWPHPLEAVFPATAPEASRAAFLRLFECASQEAQIAVVPHFDARAVQHLLVYGEPAPAVRDAVVAAHGVSAPVSQASTDSLSPEELAHLLDLDEPRVDAALFLHCRIDQRERERMLAGRLRGGGTRTVPDELLRALDEVNLGHYRHWLVAGLESGDLGVARKLMERLKLRIPAARLRLLIAVWERSGPDAVREILAMDRLPVTLRRQTEQALDAPDGLARLRARLAAEEDPAKLVAFLNKTPAYDAGQQPHKLTGDGIVLPWAALREAYRSGELTRGLPEALAERADCPRELLLEFLAHTPEDSHYHHSCIQPALDRGALTPEDLLTRSAPARTALSHLIRALDSPGRQEDRQQLRAYAAALTDEHLGTDVEAWTVCLRLLPTFAGSLTELVATAGAIVRPAD
ncbi:hypothetical protein DY245_10850 [Streptomyces inhibens]|uniref:Uncharacterized protein n=1 Tax=Streptomyces inhibens TaxID=2293571 RepID=A0A371Q6H1_STRIH|nr:hypothetical protein [Streptomyces inhibens]REK90261.1 hypothetical protein DY245_10850 [Streptomyces inhibens]